MTPTPTLAEVLQDHRQKSGLTVRELALRIAVPLDTLRGFEADSLLPTSDQVFPICEALAILPHRLLRHIGATARVILHEALEVPSVYAVAARHLDDPTDPTPAAELPVALQAAIVRTGQTVDEALSQVRQETPAERDIWVAAVVADLELEGEDVVARPLMATAELTAFCHADRSALLYRAGAPPGARPADWLDIVIEDVLHVTLSSRPLRGKLLGLCNYDQRRIVINSRLPAITFPNTYLDGLVHSTKAHELAHLRFVHHETEIRQTGCHGESAVEKGNEAVRQREFEANYYAGVFLVPSEALAAEPEAHQLKTAASTGDVIASEDLWLLAIALGRRWQVTGSLMATRLSNLGLVVKQDRTLRLPAP